MDRRAFVRSGLGTIVAIGATAIPVSAIAHPAANHAAWDAALHDYQMKRQYSDSLPTTDPRADDAVDAYCIAMDHLVGDVPSPNANALLYKMELAKERWDGLGLPDEWLDAFMADLRLLGDA
ncbi:MULTISPECIES: hypothetical protein [unclassified Novosphingobium]|uniref:hypothetical protein n=1 Tax=unclassified Novosphingobium TaxID=2644732 RepID=UPI000D31604C|nr:MULTISPECIES: hypothetical protein [unclassified Novosphingobium]PTR06448.1 hypothetical protein C8K11_12061 [Novosphingobium sp. GV055]PUA94867.1 hypothetical protein C8K12_12061 [Novosphingobium sp. GV061]PUB13792.1 hypothetical protein C8K14_12061 [Novosphingobium sp. GV079]PUB38490.1 hypothetical protein C8K10_12061 [Novosphingobium sp. GV027]